MARLSRCHAPLALLLLLFAASAAWAEGAAFCTRADKCERSPPDRARYDFYRMYHVHLQTEQHVRLFEQLERESDSCTFYGHARHPGQKLTIMVAAHKVADFADLLKSYKVEHRVLTYNFQEKIDRNMAEVLPRDSDPALYDWTHFFHLDTIYAWMERLAAEHPTELTLLDMGASAEGLPIKGLKLARNPRNPTVFVESGIHAREWIAPATATFLLQQLLTSTEPRVQRLGRDFNWIVFPVVNPDGYRFSFEGDRMWRKNRRLFGTCRGVDLNRNFPLHWNTTGTSGDPCRYDFSGPAAASEPETQRLIEFVRTHREPERILTYLSLHSFSQMIMFPYGYTAERVDNYADLTAIGAKASARILELSGRVYKSGSIHETIYPSSGGSKDWAHGELKIPITFTFELRGPPDSEDLFILPAAEITPTAEEALAAIVTIVEEAEARGYYKEEQENSVKHL